MYIFLPGNTKKHKKWGEALRDSFKDENKLMIYYDHWKGDGSIDWNTELNKIMALDIKEKVYVVGKSAGCILGLKAQKLGYIDVEKYIFIGFPYNWAKQRGDEVDYLLDNLNTKSLFIQKPKDPVIGYAELVSLLKAKRTNVDTLEYIRKGEEDNTHGYEDIEYLREEISKYAKKK